MLVSFLSLFLFTYIDFPEQQLRLFNNNNNQLQTKVTWSVLHFVPVENIFITERGHQKVISSEKFELGALLRFIQKGLQI